MIEVPLYDREGNPNNTVSFDEMSFGEKINLKTLRDAIVMYEARQRQGTVDTKERSDVEGSSRKPWQQKHTGRARAGTVRSPIWRKGGTVFGPHPRDYSYRLPNKMLKKALSAALLSKFQDKEAMVIETLSLEKPKTKEIFQLLKKMGITSSCLIGIKEPNRVLHLAVRNIPDVLLLPVKYFNAYVVMKYRRLLLTREALNEIITRIQRVGT